MRVSVCMCLFVHDHVFGTARPIFAKIFAHVTYCVTVMRSGKIREIFTNFKTAGHEFSVCAYG